MTVSTNIGVYVDVENINRSGGFGMQYDMLRKFVCHDGSAPIRLNAYVGFDRQRAKKDERYQMWTRNFFSRVRSFGYKLVEKEVRWYQDENGRLYAKANADMDMAIDVLLQSENLDRVVLVTGDGDFLQVVRALQNKGCRVEVIGFDNVSNGLKNEADMFISGYLIPDLLPIKNSKWGDIGSRVRGVCYYYKHDERFGYMRYLQKFGPLWITDSREEHSPYQSVYFNRDSMRMEESEMLYLPNRECVFEFTLGKSERFDGELQAIDIDMVVKY